MKILSILILLLSVSTVRAEWRYSASVDKMSGNESKYAILDSNNSQLLANGDVTKVSLLMSGWHRLVLYTNKGMINCYNSCSIRVKIDEELYSSWRVYQDNNGLSSDYKHLRFDNISFLQSKINQGAKKLTVELLYYKDTAKIFEFDVSGGIDQAKLDKGF